jgi:hypothetical protein
MAGKDDSQTGSGRLTQPGEALDLTTSAAGEEDPGAAIDIDLPRGTEGRNDQPAGQAPRRPSGAQWPMAPGDEAPAGTPGTGEDVCPQCGGTGRLGASACPNCQGTGKVIVGIGGA